jgi:hypothetical protein
MIVDFFKIQKEKIIVRWIPNAVLIHTHRGAYGLCVEATIEHKLSKHDD